MASLLIFLVSCCWMLQATSAANNLGMLSANEAVQFYNCSLTETSNASLLLFASQGLPDHPTQKVNPNNVTAQNYSYVIPAVQPANGTSMFCVNMGVIGFMLNGVPIYNALNAPMDGSLDAVKNEVFDNCSGHSDVTGAYHYHQLSGCVADGTVDEFLGVAIDGYPIYGPNASDVVGRLLNSSDLDACHGRFVSGTYRYYLTKDFPYTIGCFRGMPGMSNNTQQMPPAGGGAGGMGGPPGGTPVSCNTTSAGKLCDCGVGVVSAAGVAQPTISTTARLTGAAGLNGTAGLTGLSNSTTTLSATTTAKAAGSQLGYSWLLMALLYSAAIGDSCL